MLNTDNGNNQNNKLKITQLYPKSSSAHYIHTQHDEVLTQGNFGETLRCVTTPVPQQPSGYPAACAGQPHWPPSMDQLRSLAPS